MADTPTTTTELDDDGLCAGPCDSCNMIGEPCHRARAAAEAQR